MGNRIARWEIAAADAASLKRFYAELFGWVFEGDVARCGEGIDGFLFQTSGEIPPFVTVYVEARDIDAAIERAEELGGQTYVWPAPSAPGLAESVFAVVGDPDGTIIGLAGPPAPPNGHRASPAGARPIAWFEIHAADVADAARFYGEMFGWSFEPFSGYDPDYLLISTADGSIGGGLLRSAAAGEEAAPGAGDDQAVVLYVDVDDLEEALARAEGLGGKRAQAPTQITLEAGRFALARDPAGNVFGLWTAT